MDIHSYSPEDAVGRLERSILPAILLLCCIGLILRGKVGRSNGLGRGFTGYLKWNGRDMNQAEQMNAIGPLDDRSFQILVIITHHISFYQSLSQSQGRPFSSVSPLWKWKVLDPTLLLPSQGQWSSRRLRVSGKWKRWKERIEMDSRDPHPATSQGSPRVPRVLSLGFSASFNLATDLREG